MTTIHPYLTFNGNAEEAFELYRSVFGGEFAMVQRFKDAPGETLKGEENRIMHIALPIGQNMLMASDSSALHGAAVPGTNFSISINVDSQAEADRIYTALSAGGKATMPMEKTFWGAYFGMCTDRFGIAWMISFDRQNA